MSKVAVGVVLAVVAVFVVGCITQVAIETNKESGYDKLIKKVAIVVDGPGAQLEYSIKLDEYLPKAIEKSLSAAGVEVRTVRRTGLELNEDQIRARVREFGPTHVLTTKLTESTVLGGKSLRSGCLTSGTLEVTVKDADANRAVWKGKLELKRTVTLGAEDHIVGIYGIDKAAEMLTQALKADTVVK